MRLNRLDLNLLVALDALLTEQSITRAADRIHLSQPATSGALARLREYFDDELLVRVGSQMRPTPLGESLAAPVHNILMQIQATVERGVEFAPSECERTFKFLVSDYTASTLTTHVAKHLATVAPKMKLEFLAPFNSPWESLEQGEVDFLIMPLHVLSKDHPQQKAYNEDFVCVGWEQNPVIQKGFITEDEYQALGHVGVRFGSNRAPSQDQVMLRDMYNVEPNIEIITSTFGSIPRYIEGTQRISTVYRHLAELWTQYHPVKLATMPYDLPKVVWGIQWHKYRDRDPAVQWLRKTIIKIAQERFDYHE
jgi:LysR family nod box-dependent transcriptional activator